MLREWRVTCWASKAWHVEEATEKEKNGKLTREKATEVLDTPRAALGKVVEYCKGFSRSSVVLCTERRERERWVTDSLEYKSNQEDMPSHTVTKRTILYHTKQYCIIPYHTIHTISYKTIAYYTIPDSTTPYTTTSDHIIPNCPNNTIPQRPGLLTRIRVLVWQDFNRSRQRLR